MATAKEQEEDPFEAIFFSEDRAQRQGYEEGYTDGSQKGLNDGYTTGYDKGQLIGEEIGFYFGFCKTWLIILNQQEIDKEKVKKVLLSLVSNVKQFQLLSVDDTTYMDQLHHIRGQYRQVISLLKLKTESSTQETNSLTF